jgi:hypothetical protein
MDSGPDALWDTRLDGGVEVWVRDRLSERLGSTYGQRVPLEYTLAAGTHTLRIKQRENGTKLDKLLITNDLTYVPQD